jgi:hypothetical protein
MGKVRAWKDIALRNERTIRRRSANSDGNRVQAFSTQCSPNNRANGGDLMTKWIIAQFEMSGQ